MKKTIIVLRAERKSYGNKFLIKNKGGKNGSRN